MAPPSGFAPAIPVRQSAVPYVTVCLTYAAVCVKSRHGAGTQGAKHEKAPPLDAERLIAAGFDALAGGRHRCRAGRAARQGARHHQGQLHWHFADRRALLDAMLTPWTQGRSRRSASRRLRGAPGGGAADHSPTSTRATPMYADLPIELAIRSLAHLMTAAVTAVRRVDR